MPQQLNPDDRLEFPPDIAEVVDKLWESVQTMQTLPMAALEERLRTLDRQARAMGYQMSTTFQSTTARKATLRL